MFNDITRQRAVTLIDFLERHPGQDKKTISRALFVGQGTVSVTLRCARNILASDPGRVSRLVWNGVGYEVTDDADAVEHHARRNHRYADTRAETESWNITPSTRNVFGGASVQHFGAHVEEVTDLYAGLVSTEQVA